MSRQEVVLLPERVGALFDIESLLRREAEDLLPHIEESIREGDFEMAALNKAEQAFMEEAVVLARQLGRPFGEKEVLFHALREGYELHLAFDNRFRKVAPRNGNVPAQWVLDEDPERLKNEAMADFFIGMKLYVRRRIDLAQIYASEICNREQLLPWGQRHNKRDLIKELLQEQGWELTDKQVEQIALGLVIKENEND